MNIAMYRKRCVTLVFGAHVLNSVLAIRLVPQDVQIPAKRLVAELRLHSIPPCMLLLLPRGCVAPVLQALLASGISEICERSR